MGYASQSYYLLKKRLDDISDKLDKNKDLVLPNISEDVNIEAIKKPEASGTIATEIEPVITADVNTDNEEIVLRDKEPTEIYEALKRLDIIESKIKSIESVKCIICTFITKLFRKK